MTALASPSRGIVRGSLVSVAGRALDLPGRYGFHLLVAASLGAMRAGEFYIVFSIMVALAGFGRLGIDRALTRQIAMAVATHRSDVVRPLIWHGLGLALLASGLVAGLLAILAHPLAAWVLHKPELALPLALGALAIVPQNLGAMTAGVLAGLHRIGLSQMIYSWLWPALFCVVTLIVGTSVTGALVLIALCFAVAALVGGVLVILALRRVPGTGASGMPAVCPPLIRPGLSLFTLDLTQLLIASAPAFILGMVASTQAVGMFALAWRVALLVNIAISGVASMAAPKFAALHARGDRAALARAATQAVGLGLGLAVLPVAAMLLAPAQLLDLFGHGYGQGASTLRILALGQMGAACFTAMPELLGMTAHAASLRRINGLSLAVLLVGAAFLAPLWSSAGTAVATALAIVVNGGAAAWVAHRHLGVAGPVQLYRLVRGRVIHSRRTGAGGDGA